jgi:hypothetical protein
MPIGGSKKLRGYVNILIEHVNIIKKRETVLGFSKEFGLEVNAEKQMMSHYHIVHIDS